MQRDHRRRLIEEFSTFGPGHNLLADIMSDASTQTKPMKRSVKARGPPTVKMLRAACKTVDRRGGSRHKTLQQIIGACSTVIPAARRVMERALVLHQARYSNKLPGMVRRGSTQWLSMDADTMRGISECMGEVEGRFMDIERTARELVLPHEEGARGSSAALDHDAGTDLSDFTDSDDEQDNESAEDEDEDEGTEGYPAQEPDIQPRMDLPPDDGSAIPHPPDHVEPSSSVDDKTDDDTVPPPPNNTESSSSSSSSAE